MSKSKVALMGTCANSTWRDKLIPMLKIDYYNPVVEDWTPECAKEEIKQRESCDYCLYVITPKKIGDFAIAEVTEDAIIRPNKTIFCFLHKDEDREFSPAQIKSLDAVGALIARHKAKVFSTLEEIAEYLNKS